MQVLRVGRVALSQASPIAPTAGRIAIGTTEGVCLWRGERGIGVDYLGIWRDHRSGEKLMSIASRTGPMAGGSPAGLADGAVREWDAETGAMRWPSCADIRAA